MTEKVTDKKLNTTNAKPLKTLIQELLKKGLLTEEEKDIILGNEEKGIEAEYRITIGNQVIDFKLEIDYANLEPGLYETGTDMLLKSWEQMVEDGELVISGSQLYHIDNTLKGDLVIKEGITSIYDYIFRKECGGNEVNITGLVIPSTVEELNISGEDNATIKNIFIKDGVEKVQLDSFKGLIGIRLPDTIIEIRDYAFYECSNLKSITIPSAVTSIGESAFYGCTSLETIELPKNPITIGKNAFYDCTGITKVRWKLFVAKFSNVSTGNSILTDIFNENYISYALNIIGSLSEDENVRNEELTNIYIEGFKYWETVYGVIPEGTDINTLQDIWDLNHSDESECPYNNILEVYEAEGGEGGYEGLVESLINDRMIDPEGFDKNN